MPGHRSTGFWSSLRELYGITDAPARRQIGLLVLLTIVGAFGELFAIATVVPFLALLASGAAAPQKRWIQPLFDAVGADTLSKELAAATVLLGAAAIVSGALRLLLERRTQDFVFSFGHRLSLEVQRRMLLQPYSWHVRQNSSQQLAAVERVELVAGMVLMPLVHAIAGTAMAALILALLLRIAPGATIAAGLVVGTVYYAVATLARKRLHAYSERINSGFEQRIRILQEGLAGIRDLILEGSQEAVLNRFGTIDLQLAQARADSIFVSSVPRFLVEAVGIVTIAVLALLLSRRDGGLLAALPILGAVALGAQRLLPLVQQLYQGWSSVAANRSLIDDLATQLRLRVPAVPASITPLPFKASIEFHNVGYRYPERAEPAVSDLSFAITRGARVALVGPTGSGKSTTADLLMGLLDPDEGTIAVDGVQLNDDNRQAWRANVAHVPQILFVADATIARNISLATEIDMERVREAASLSQLDQFVRSLPDGFDTVVGERGARISGGQRQRLAIARAIYRNTPLLVLDEATSALDNETEAAILDATDKLQQQGRTVVIIAHRSKLVESCDMLLRLDQGRIVSVSKPKRGRGAQ